MGEKLTLTRVLTELKLIDKKIDSALKKNLISVFRQKSKYVAGSTLNIEDYRKEAKENLQSIQDLIKRKEKLKLALSKANSTTKILIKDKDFNISDAIAYKESVLPIMEYVVQELKRRHVEIVNLIERNKKEVDENVLKLLQENVGKEKRTDDKQLEQIKEFFTEQNELKCTDNENSVKNYIDELEKEIVNFKSEVDFALSEVNAKTEVEIN
jgi:uncharacterized protein YfkK (UPF0435 family)